MDAQLKASASSANDLPVRVRKTYTITKQRERWTEEEHEKFLEAIKLYGRAWRQLQEHIGTKTVLQIRSHAQKFFSKTSQNLGPGETVEIPPPRPKRKPLRPYPRKLDHFATRVKDMKRPVKISPPVPSVSEQKSRSPVSVLTAAGSDASDSHASNTLSKLDESPVDLGLGSEELKSTKESSPLEAQSTSIKLFGRTVSVDNHINSCLSDNENVNQRVKLVPSTAYEEEIGMHMKNKHPLFKHFESYDDPYQIAGRNLWDGAAMPMHYHLVPDCVQTKSAEKITAPVPFWFSSYGRLPYPFTNQLNASVKHDLDQTGKCGPTQSTAEEGMIHNGEDLQCCRLWNQPSHTFRLKPSENSAFSSVKARTKKPASLCQSEQSAI